MPSRGTTPRRPVKAWMCALAAAAGATAVLQADQAGDAQRQAGQAPVFRSRADVVPLTVTVLDRRGVPVTGLEAAEFTVLEDGRRRDIVAFHAQAYQPAAPGTTAPGSLAPASRRTFLLVLGFGRIQHPIMALDGAIAFVRDRLSPDDAIAVMAFHRTTAFTTDHAAVLRLLERFRNEHERHAFELTEYMRRVRGPGSRGGPPVPQSMLAAVDNDIFRESGDAEGESMRLRNTADLLLAMDLAPPNGDKPWKQQLTFADVHRWTERAGYTVTDALITSDRLKFLAAIEYLRRMEGEKRMVFLSRGSISGSYDEASLAAARANSARIAVDFFFTAGTRMRGTQGCEPCRRVSELTGGLYSSVDYAVDALARVDAATRAAYLLGYVPTDAVNDGRYRRVEVRVNRRDVTVQVRRGYYAEPVVAPEVLRATTIKARMDAALVSTEDARDIDIRATADVLPGASSGIRVWVSFDPAVVIDAGSGGASRVQLQIFCGTTKEKIVGQLAQTIELPRPVSMPGRVSRQVDVPVSAPARYVKVVVYDYQSDRVGSITIDLQARPK